MSPDTKQWVIRIVIGLSLIASAVSFYSWLNGISLLGRSDPLRIGSALLMLVVAGVWWWRLRRERQSANKPKRGGTQQKTVADYSEKPKHTP